MSLRPSAGRLEGPPVRQYGDQRRNDGLREWIRWSSHRYERVEYIDRSESLSSTCCLGMWLVYSTGSAAPKSVDMTVVVQSNIQTVPQSI